jgi:hypothetical protein
MTEPTMPDDKRLEHIEDVMMQLIIGTQMHKVLPNEVHAAAMALDDYIQEHAADEHRRQTDALLDEILAELPKQEVRPERGPQHNGTAQAVRRARNKALTEIQYIITKHKTPDAKP